MYTRLLDFLCLFTIIVLFVSCGESGSEEQDLLSSDTSSLAEPAQDMTNGTSNEGLNMRKWQDRVSFYAMGTEPFWSLDLVDHEQFRFNQLGGDTIEFDVIDVSRAQGANVVRYVGRNRGDRIKVTIQEESCSDQMSDNQFEYATEVRMTRADGNNADTFQGCGNYVLDVTLHNIWLIESFNGRRLQSADFNKGLPNLEINIMNRTMLGHDGCNTIRGGITAGDGSIGFGKMSSTLMACPNQDQSNQITSQLQGGRFTYKFTDRLILERGGEPVFVLRNVD